MKTVVNLNTSLIKIFELHTEPVVITVNDVKEVAVADFSYKMFFARSTGQPVIPVVIDSYGGDVYSLLAMGSIIESSPIPVATVAVGKAMSAGAMLLGYGHESLRYAAPNATIMIHEVSSWTHGKVNEVRVDADESERLNTELMKKLAIQCGQSAKFFLDKIHDRNHADWYMTAKEAKKIGLIDHIGLPELRIDIDAKMSFN